MSLFPVLPPMRGPLISGQCNVFAYVFNPESGDYQNYVLCTLSVTNVASFTTSLVDVLTPCFVSESDGTFSFGKQSPTLSVSFVTFPNDVNVVYRLNSITPTVCTAKYLPPPQSNTTDLPILSLFGSLQSNYSVTPMAKVNNANGNNDVYSSFIYTTKNKLFTFTPGSKIFNTLSSTFFFSYIAPNGSGSNTPISLTDSDINFYLLGTNFNSLSSGVCQNSVFFSLSPIEYYSQWMYTQTSSFHCVGGQFSTKSDKCAFTSVQACEISFFYDYCLDPNFCGSCYGICSQNSVPCQEQTPADIDNDKPPFICTITPSPPPAPTPSPIQPKVSPFKKYKKQITYTVIAIICLVIVALFLLVIITPKKTNKDDLSQLQDQTITSFNGQDSDYLYL